MSQPKPPGAAVATEPVDILAAASTLYRTLHPLTAEERRKAMNGALALLGDPALTTMHDLRAADGVGASAVHPTATSHTGLSAEAQKWLKRFDLTLEQLENVLTIEGQGTKPFTLPDGVGTSSRERTQAAYLLQGIAALFGTGRASFTDEAARQFCVRLGCYDPTNHAKHVKSMRGRHTGSKDAGYTLTQPGLTAAAALLKRQ